MGRAIYKREKPNLAIRNTGGAKLGNCYNASYYKITSIKKLDKKTIEGLRDLGLLGCGQEFKIKSQCDGNEEPAGYDYTPCIDEETGERAVNPYKGDGSHYPDHEDPYYEYHIERRVDSSG